MAARVRWLTRRAGSVGQAKRHLTKRPWTLSPRIHTRGPHPPELRATLNCGSSFALRIIDTTRTRNPLHYDLAGSMFEAPKPPPICLLYVDSTPGNIGGDLHVDTLHYDALPLNPLVGPTERKMEYYTISTGVLPQRGCLRIMPRATARLRGPKKTYLTPQPGVPTTRIRIGGPRAPELRMSPN